MYALLQGAIVEGLQSRMKERCRVRRDRSAPKKKVAKKEEKQKRPAVGCDPIDVPAG